MRNLYNIVVVLTLVFICNTNIYAERGRISGNLDVCSNETALVTFSISNSDRNSPYTFTYTINGVTQPTISGSDSVTINAPTDFSGTFTYIITGVKDKDNKDVEISSNNHTAIITVSSSLAPTISGALFVCDGLTSQLSGTATAASSNPWQSSDQGVATVNNNGLVTGLSPGTTTITYSNTNGCSNNVLFTVYAIPTISVQGGGGGNTICGGKTLNLNGNGTPNSTNPWTSSNNAIATVDNTGLVTGVSAGSATITYTNSNGCQITKGITVVGTAVDFTFNDNQCSGSAVQFNTTSSGSTYTWNFGDGGTSSQQNPTHTYNSLGCGTESFNVSLTITGSNGCSNTKQYTVIIKQKPDVNFIDNSVIYNPFNTSNQFNNCNSAGANPNYNVSVAASSANSACITSYSVVWQNGDTPETFTTFPFTHSYSSLGAFNMAITANGSNGCSTTKYYTIKNESNPAGGLVSPGSTTNLCAITPNLQFTISNWALNSPGTSYSINYGDGSPLVSLLQSDLIQNILYYNSVNPSLSLNYPIPHIYEITTCPNASITATLIISNSCGTTNSTISPIVILRPATPNFTNPPNVCVNSCVLFTNTSIPSYNENCIENTMYEWDFGDGSSKYIITAPGKPNPPCHTYTLPGNYSITLKTYGYCTSNIIKTGTICVEPPLVPSFTLSPTAGCTPLSVATTNTTNLVGSCAATYLWNVAYATGYCGTTSSYTLLNGTTLTSFAPEFNFINPGIYSLSLTTTNSCGPVTSATQTVIVKQPPTVAITTIQPLCQNLPTTTINPVATVVNCGTQSPLTYEWIFPGGTPVTPATLTTAIPGPISYSTSGTFLFSLKVTNECGSTTANSSITINPSPTLTGTLFSCIGATSQLTGSLTAATIAPWTSSVPAVATVNNTGLVTGVSAGTTTITYTDSNGCKTTALFTVNPSPTATISGTTTVCLNDAQPSVTFTGANGVAPYTFTYNINGGISQTVNTISGNSVTVAVPTSTAGVFQYNLVKVQDLSTTTCSQTLTSFVAITVRPLPTASITGTTSICQGGALPLITFIGANGTAPYTFTYNINGGTSQTVTTTIGNSITVNAPTTTSGIFTYNLVSIAYATAPSCPQPQSSSATVTVNPLPTATIGGTTTVCLNTSPQPGITFTGLGGTAPYTFTYTINGGASQTATTTAGSNVTIPVSTTIAGTFAYNLVSVQDSASPSCSKPQTMTATIIVKPLPIATIGGTSIVCLNASQPVITFTGTGGTAPYSFTYSINSGTPQTITTTSGSSVTLSVSTATSGIFVYTLLSIQDGATPSCNQSQTGTATITVNTLPSASISGTTTICQGGTSPQITFTGSNGVAPYTFSYNINGGVSQTVTTTSGNSITVAVPTTASGSFIYNLISVQYGTAPTCVLPQTGSATVTINASPLATITGNTSVCLNDTQPGVTFTGTNGVAPYTFTYNINGGILQSITTTAGNTITVSAPTTTAGSFVYNLTGVQDTSSTTCSQSFTTNATVVVNLRPIVTNQTGTFCSDSPIGISFNSSTSVPAATYTITTINSNGLFPSAGSPITGSGFTANEIANDAWTNSTPIAVDVVYTVVPVSAAGCLGNPFSVTVTVDPEPIVVNQTDTICSDIANGIVLGNDIDTPSVATYNISNINPNGLTPFGGNPVMGTGFSANEIADDAWTNTTPAAVNVIYTVVPVSAAGCEGNPFTVTVTVESTLGVGPQTVATCSDVAHGFILGTAINTTYDIISINSYGLIASAGNPVIGTGFLASEIANDAWTNTTPVAVNVVYTIAPKSPNGCSGQPFTVTVTVNPEPVVLNQIRTICSDSPIGISFNSSTSILATTYNITAINQNGLIASAGNPITGSGFTANEIANDAWTNSTPIAVDVVYTVVPVSAAGCLGNPFSVTVAVDPEPIVVNQTRTICSDIANGIVLGNDIDTPSVATYNISNINPNGLTPFGGNPVMGTGFSANEIADDTWTNTTPAAVNVVYTVVPVSAAGCEGNPFTVTVTVESTLGVGPQTVTTCSDIAQGFILGTAINTTYTITNINVNGLTSIGGNPVTGNGFGASEIADDVWDNITASPVNVIYTVEPVSANGCSGQPFTVTVTVNPEPVILNQIGTICSDSPIGISFNSSTSILATTYNITAINQNGLIASAGNPVIGTGFSLNVIADDAWTNTTPIAVDVVYTVVPVSAAGCLGNPFSVTVAVDPEPVVVNQTRTICSDIANGIVLGNDVDTPSVASYNVISINNGGLVASAGNPQKGIGLLANEITDDAWTNTGVSSVNVIYSLVPVSASGCEGNPFIVTITIESELAIAGQSTTVCSDAVNGIILGTEPTATYTVTSIVSNGLNASAGNPQVGTGFLANDIADDAWTNLGTAPVVIVYNIIPQSNSGCLGNPFTITLTINPEPIVGNQVVTVCSDESTNVILGDDVDGPSATTYIITNINSNGLFSFAGNPKVGSGFSANEIANDAWTNTTLLTVSVVYQIIPVSADGCQGNPFTISINVNPQINIAIVTTPIICYGANDASITLTVTGGSSPYQAQWDNLATGFYQNNLSANTYVILVTDSKGCTRSVTVNIPEAPIFTINPVVKNISCFGDKNGSINLNIVGGIAPVKLVWDDSAVAGNVRNNLGPGSYTVTITDGKPCTIKRTFIILEPQLLVLSANVNHAFDCDNANSGAINLLVAGGSAPFTYDWSNGSTYEDLVNIPAGNYLVTVKDMNGCTQQAQYSINRPPPIVTSVLTKTDFNCETKYIKQTFVAEVSGGVPPYQSVWSSGTVSGPNNELMNTSQNGTVVLYVTDAIGCKSNYTFTVTNPKLGTPSFNSSSYANSTYGTYSINDPIQFTNTATGDYISMIWDFGDGTFSTALNPVHTFINSKEYVVTQTVTYPFGCVYVQKITFIVEKGYLLVVPNAFTPNNDSLNDTFRPVTKGLKNVRLDIYDTWGSMIYSENGDVLTGWNGKIKGVNAENGNYYCKVSGETFYGIIVNENHPFVLLK